MTSSMPSTFGVHRSYVKARVFSLMQSPPSARVYAPEGICAHPSLHLYAESGGKLCRAYFNIFHAELGSDQRLFSRSRARTCTTKRAGHFSRCRSHTVGDTKLIALMELASRVSINVRRRRKTDAAVVPFLSADILQVRHSGAVGGPEGREAHRPHYSTAGEMQGLPGATQTQHSEGRSGYFSWK